MMVEVTRTEVNVSASEPSPHCEHCKEYAEPSFTPRCSLDCPRRYDWEFERAQKIPVLAGKSNPLRLCEYCRDTPKAEGNMRYCSRNCRNRSRNEGRKARAREAKLENERERSRTVVDGGYADRSIAKGMSPATPVFSCSRGSHTVAGRGGNVEIEQHRSFRPPSPPGPTVEMKGSRHEFTYSMPLNISHNSFTPADAKDSEESSRKEGAVTNNSDSEGWETEEEEETSVGGYTNWRSQHSRKSKVACWKSKVNNLKSKNSDGDTEEEDSDEEGFFLESDDTEHDSDSSYYDDYENFKDNFGLERAVRRLKAQYSSPANREARKAEERWLNSDIVPGKPASGKWRDLMA